MSFIMYLCCTSHPDEQQCWNSNTAARQDETNRCANFLVLIMCSTSPTAAFKLDLTLGQSWDRRRCYRRSVHACSLQYTDGECQPDDPCDEHECGDHQKPPDK